MGSISLLDVALAILGVLLVKRLLSRSYPAPLPPGPKVWLPLVGNLFQMPSEKEWLTFAKWGDTWGDICSATVFGQHMIIVNSADVASEMLCGKGTIYSDRPELAMFGELVGFNKLLSFSPYGNRWRSQRTLLQRTLGTSAAVKQFHGVEQLEAHRALKRILRKPSDVSNHIRKTAGAIILGISHGYEVKEGKDSFVDLAEEVMDNFSATLRPGAFLVDLIPPLRHIPEWFPGAGFKKQAKAWAHALTRFVDDPHKLVKKQMMSGTATPSFTTALLDDSDFSPEKEFDIKWSAAMIFAGGADTTVSSVYALFLAMALYPDVQKKAQAEIDAVIGNDRLPTSADRQYLPYVEALCTELMRWHSVAPLNFRRVVEDDIQGGYFIPKNSTILINQWKITHDPQTYPDPMKFDPTRFIPSEGKICQNDPRLYCFGTGKRICPGRVLADSSIFITCAMILAVFDISKQIENGVVVEPVINALSGGTSHLAPFKCRIFPRSEKAVVLIEAEEAK